MARIVLKDPRSPSLKKTMKPPSLRYKSLFYQMALLNIIQTISIVYLINKDKIDPIIIPIVKKAKQLL
jgi:hypothetical protein